MSIRRDRIGWRRLAPPWLADYAVSWLRPDLTAGLTLAVMLIPQAMAYASLAGMPPITGLYAAIVALIAYAALGTSSHLSFGPFALVALLSAAAVAPLADGQPARYIALSGVLALMVGVLHLLLAAVRAGGIVELISHPVVVGFTAAVGIVIALSQVPDLTGADVERSDRFVEAVVAVVDAVPGMDPTTLLVGVTAVVLLVLGRRYLPRVPVALLVVAMAVLCSVVFDLSAAGVAVIGSIPAGLPRPGLPSADLTDVRALLPAAAALAAICFAGNVSMARAVATRTRERLDPQRELVASGAANLASGVVGGFPVSASFTRTVVVFDAGARTQLAGLVASAVLVLTLLVLTPLLEPLPRAVLAAIVILAVVGLVDVRSARAILRTYRTDGAVMTTTFVATLAVGPERGLLIGVVTNLVVYVVRRMRPALVVLGRVQGAALYRNVKRYPTVTDPSGVILRLDGALDFLSAERVTGRIRDLVAKRPEITWIVFVASGVTDMDTTGIRGLHDVQQHLREAGVELHLATLRGVQRDALRRAGLWSDLMATSCHPDVRTALIAAGVAADAPVLSPEPEERPPDQLL